MKISFIGYYGSNFGDLLMLTSLIDYYGQHYNQINIYTYGNEDNLCDSLLLNAHRNKIQIFGLTGDKKVSYSNFFKTVKGSKYIIWGGGTCFMDQGGTGGLKYMIEAYFAKVSILYLGVGIDSDHKAKTKLIVFTAVLLSKALYFRDEKSLLRANNLTFNLFKHKIKHVPDIAHINTIQNKSDSSDYIVFCCRDLSSYEYVNNEKVNNYLTGLAIAVCKHLSIKRIVNLICDLEVDDKQSRIANELFVQNGIVVNNVFGYKVEDSLIAIKNSKFVISSRLHPAVIAQNLSVPYALFNYSDKNKKFVEDTNENSRLIGRNNFEEYIPDFQKPKIGNLENKRQSILNVLAKYSK
mgnify:CR=1 FL=1